MLQKGPARGLARGRNRHRAEPGPELNERAKNGSFGELAAKELAQLDGGRFSFPIERFPGADDEG
jgi:hypothetical protein